MTEERKCPRHGREWVEFCYGCISAKAYEALDNMRIGPGTTHRCPTCGDVHLPQSVEAEEKPDAV